MLAGNATSVVLDQNSGLLLDPNSGQSPSDGRGSPTSALRAMTRIIFAGFRRASTATERRRVLYMSANQGQSWTLMTGNIGNPLILQPRYQILTTSQPENQNQPPMPSEKSSFSLFPPRPNNYLESELYAGWLYAAVATPDRRLRRFVRDRGLRRELDADPIGQPARGFPPKPTTTRAFPVQPGAANGDTAVPYAITTMISATSLLP